MTVGMMMTVRFPLLVLGCIQRVQVSLDVLMFSCGDAMQAFHGLLGSRPGCQFWVNCQAAEETSQV